MNCIESFLFTRRLNLFVSSTCVVFRRSPRHPVVDAGGKVHASGSRSPRGARSRVVRLVANDTNALLRSPWVRKHETRSSSLSRCDAVARSLARPLHSLTRAALRVEKRRRNEIELVLSSSRFRSSSPQENNEKDGEGGIFIKTNRSTVHPLFFVSFPRRVTTR